MKEFIWNKHPEIKEGQHAILAPSRKLLHRNKMTNEDLDTIIRSNYAAQIGTEIHNVAARLIEEKQSITKAGVKAMIFDQLYQKRIPRKLIEPELYLDTVVPYIKDAIGFGLDPEVPIVYKYPIAYGTADAIRYNPYNSTLRIHDLKTGKTPASLDQLVEYAAYFFLEYHIKPADTQVIIAIYQNGEVITGYPQASDIVPIMDNAVALTKYIRSNYEEA
jgi:hypothetical protein